MRKDDPALIEMLNIFVRINTSQEIDPDKNRWSSKTQEIVHTILFWLLAQHTRLTILTKHYRDGAKNVTMKAPELLETDIKSSATNIGNYTLEQLLKSLEPLDRCLDQLLVCCVLECNLLS